MSIDPHFFLSNFNKKLNTAAIIDIVIISAHITMYFVDYLWLKGNVPVLNFKPASNKMLSSC